MEYFSFVNILLRLGSILKINIIRVQNVYINYIPDRYSLNFDKYKDMHGFLEYRDLKVWNKNNYFNNVGDCARFFFLNLCIDSLIEEKIYGDVAEVGVYKGNSAGLLTRIATKIGSRCYLFDTFEGFDEGDKIGLDAGLDATFSDTSLEEVRKVVGDKNTVFVKGHFPESLAQLNGKEKFCLVHIDCDLALPVLAALEYFYSRVVEGGFLIIHDYNSMFWPGCTESVQTFFRDKPEYVIPIPDKSGTCVIRKVKCNDVKR